MKKPVIFTIKHAMPDKGFKNRDNGMFIKFFGNYALFKSSIEFDDLDSKDRKSLDDLLSKADTVFDVAEKGFTRLKYVHLSPEIDRTFQLVQSITADKPLKKLIKQFSKEEVLFSVFLTEKYEQYEKQIDYLEYQSVCFKNGAYIPKNILKRLVAEVPELMI